MHLSRSILAAAVLSVSGVTVIAAPKPPAARPHGPSPHTSGSRPAKPTHITHEHPQITTHSQAKTKTPKTPTARHSSSETTAAAPAPAPATDPATTTTMNPIAQKISSNHGLKPKVTALLPTGMTIDQASLGFKNQGQFLAALHVSRNLGIPFADLKTAMTGITPTAAGTTGTTDSGAPSTSTAKTMSLGQAIHTLRPSTNAESAAATAQHQATADLSAPTTGSAATIPPKHGK